MPKKGKTRNTNNNNRSRANVGKKKPLLLVSLITLTAVIFVAICGVYINSTKQENTVQSDMKEYLQNKYGKEFTVEKPQRKASGFGVEGYFESLASPLHDSGLSFSVIYTKRSITDNYPGAVWSKSETSRLQPVINSYFGSNLDFAVEIKTSGTLRGNLDIRGGIMPFGEAAKMYGHKIVYRLSVRTKDTIDDVNRGYIASKIYDFIKHEIRLDTDIIFVYSYEKGGKEYGVALDETDISRIGSATDVEKMFKEW